MKKRVLRFLLSFIILFSAGAVCLTTAYADEEEEQEEDENDEEDEDTGDDEEEDTSSSSSSGASALLTNDKIKSSEKAKTDAEQTKAALAQGQENAKRIIASLETAKSDAQEYVTKIDGEISNIQDKIDALSANIVRIREDIAETERELEEAEKIRAQQYEYMKMRIKASYESREETIAEAIFTSKGIGELLNRSLYLNEVAAYDNKKLAEYAETVKTVNETAERLAGEEEELKDAMDEALSEETAAQALLDEKEQEVAAYTASIGDKEAQIREYQAMIAEQNSIIASMEAAIKAERERLAAEARKYGGGVFAHPCPDYTRISDEYGMRMHPTLGVELMHNGIDFAAPSGTPIYAAADGEVIGAGYSASMGNYIMIDHGSDIISIYMHASKLLVSQGEEVSKGSKIALVGSTGRSTGPHLHFGVRENGSYVNPSKYLGG